MNPRALSRRSLTYLWLPALATLACLACGSPADVEVVASRPNVLLILVDDLRPDLGTYGHTSVQSPAIDRLAATGMRFDRAYVQYPACNPSRTSMLTGLRPDTTGVVDNRTPFPSDVPGVVFMPQLFGENGYLTASVGKVLHGSGRKGNLEVRQAWDLEVFPRSAKRGTARTDESLLRGRVGRYAWTQVPPGGQGLQDTRIADHAIKVLSETRGRPFFMAVGLGATHPHFVAPVQFFDLYPVDSITLPPLANANLSLQLAHLHGWSDEEVSVFSEQEKKELIRAYWACVSFVDAQVGRLLDALDRFELTGNTIVVLTSDHGYHLGEQGWWSKRTLYEASTRVPVIVRAPGTAAPGSSTRRLIELVDLYPTLAELAGLEIPPGIEGRSLVPLLEDPDLEWKTAVFSQLTLGRLEGRSVRTEDWRYTEWDRGQRSVELFEFATASTETTNRAEDPQFEDVRRQLAALLQ